MPQHFVVTRIGLGVYDEGCLADMIDLFEIVTLPSLVGQTSQQFIWLVVIDAGMPVAARRRIEARLRPYPHFHVVAIDVTRLTHVRQGCFDWVWDCCQDHIMETGLIDDTGQYVVTSLIDADDAWHRDVVGTVNAHMASRLPGLTVGEENRGTWLRHTAGIAATFTRGYKWFIEHDAWEPAVSPFMSMSVFVAARFSSGISVCSSRHLGWPSYCKVLAFEMQEVEQNAPMWLYVRHHRTTQPWDAAAIEPAGAAVSRERCESFGIDLERLRQWRDRSSGGSGKPHRTAHAGRSASEQYDRIFKLAALNRQIAALQRRRDRLAASNTDQAASAEEAIAAKQAQRMDLIGLLRSSDDINA